MSIVSVHPDWNRSAGSSFDPSSLRVIHRSTRRWVIKHSAGDDPVELKAEARAVGWFPVEGQPDPEDPNLRCTDCVVQGWQGNLTSEALVTFQSIPMEDPTAALGALSGWTIEIDSDDSEEAIDRDADGRAIQTVTGEQFDPPLTDTVSDLALVFSRSDRIFRPDLLILYGNCVNSDVFMGSPPGTARIKRRTGRVTVDDQGRVQAAELSLRVVFRYAHPGSIHAKAWWKRVRAEGFYVYDYQFVPPKRIRALDGFGEPVTNPVMHRIQGNPSFIIQGAGSKIDDPNDCEFYEIQPPSLVYRPFTQFFQYILA